MLFRSAVRSVWNGSNRRDLPGLWVGVWDPKRGAFVQAYGYAAPGRRATPADHTRIGDITASMSAAVRGTGDHVYMGIGGSTEGVITAAALECLGGEIQARMWPKDDSQRERLKAYGLEDTDRVLTARDLAPQPMYVLATGVTDGYLLKGVRYFSDGARTHSILMDLQSRTVRFVDTIHMFSRTPLREIRL